MIKTRDEYIELVKKELMGPGSEISIPDEEHELISDAPNTRYSVGVLFTQNTKMNADNNDASRVEELDSDVQPEEETIKIDNEEGFVKHHHAEENADEENLDEEIGLATQNMPSSMGITFFIKGDCKTSKRQSTTCYYNCFTETVGSGINSGKCCGKIYS